MRTIRLLAASLLVALCAGFSSCGDDELEREPVINFDPNGNNGSSDLEKTYSQYIDDYENMTCKRFNDNGDTIEFTGITAKGYLMINLFQKATKAKVFDWVDNVKTDTIYKVYKGYGEYEEVTVKSIGLSHSHIGKPHIESNKDFIILLDFFGGTSPFTRILFVNEGKSKMSNIMPVDSWSIRTFIPDWYNNEYSFIHDCCYTSTGDTVYAIEYGKYDNNDVFQYILSKVGITYMNAVECLSAEEVVINGKINYATYWKVYNVKLSRLNLKQDKILWWKEVNLPFDYEANAKLSYSIVNKSANIWEYKADIIYYDGTKKDYTFYLNIENGTISEALSNSPLVGSWIYITDEGYKEIITFYSDNTGSWESVNIHDNTSNTDPFTYTMDDKEEKFIIDFGDNSPETYYYNISDNKMKLMYEDGHVELYTKQ